MTATRFEFPHKVYLLSSYLPPRAADPVGTAIGGARLSVRWPRPLTGRRRQRTGPPAGLQTLAGHLPPAPALPAGHRALGPHGHRPAVKDRGVQPLKGKQAFTLPETIKGQSLERLRAFQFSVLGRRFDKTIKAKIDKKTTEINRSQIVLLF